MTLAVSSHGVQCPCVPMVEHFAASSCVSLIKVTLKALSSFLLVFRKPTKESVWPFNGSSQKKKMSRNEYFTHGKLSSKYF